MPKLNSRQGGFVAQNQGKIENCFSVVQIKGKGNYLGGFAGENSGEIKKSYAYSSLTGRDSGFIGNDTRKQVRPFSTGTFESALKDYKKNYNRKNYKLKQ